MASGVFQVRFYRSLQVWMVPSWSMQQSRWQEDLRRLLRDHRVSIASVAAQTYAYQAPKVVLRRSETGLRLRAHPRFLEMPPHLWDALLLGLLRSWFPVVEGDPRLQAHAEARAWLQDQRVDRKMEDQVQGRHHSLRGSYLRVVLEYDLHLADPPRLSWSKRVSKRRLGYHEGHANRIVISRVLDDPRVPEYVLDTIVYHEILHILHPPRQGTGEKRIIHHKGFRQAEARNPQLEDAHRFLSEFLRHA